MSPHEFVFELALPDPPDGVPPGNPLNNAAMLADLAAAVLWFVGYPPEAVAELTALMSGALADGSASGRQQCRVAFRAHDGHLHIAVEYDGAAQWRTGRPLP